jgi:uncharacterized protein YdaU (DUF1376 family)
LSRATPAIPFFGDAYIADTRHLNLEEHGAYLQLLMIAWRSDDCSLPNDDKRIAQMLGITAAKWGKLKPTIMAFWTLTGGRWSQKRLAKERKFVSEKSEKNAQSAKSRWNGQPIENNRGGRSGRTSERTSERICQNDAPPPPPKRSNNTPSSNTTSARMPEDVRSVLDEGGFVSPPPDLGLMREWYEAGADLQQDILPTVRAVRARLSKAPFKLKVFDAAIREKLAADNAEIERLRNISRRYEAEEERQRQVAASGGQR